MLDGQQIDSPNRMATTPPLRPPKPPAYDLDWSERIQRAKRAREEGRKAREGKPATFSYQQSLT